MKWGEHMKFAHNLLTLTLLIPALTWAQGGVDADVDQEIDQLYAAPAQKNAAPMSASAQVPSQQQLSPINATQPIYILNQATPAGTASVGQPAAQVHKQPTTYVEASPLTESRADMMRKARQETELQTETKIVEKLEQSRMEDEKKRAQVLFGDKFDQLGDKSEKSSAQPQAPAAQPVPVQVIPVPMAQPPQTENTRDVIREELQSALKTEKELPQQPVESRYFGAIAGVSEYPDVSNVSGNYSLGFTFGTKYDSTYAVEGSFLFSNYNLKNVDGNGVQYFPFNQDVNQYSGSLALKYFMLNGMVKPVIGGLVQYSYRTYSWSDSSYGNKNLYKDSNSHAIDLGAIVGADIDLSARTSIGLDFRYIFNMSSRTNNNSYTPPGTTALEKLSYYTVSLTGKVNF